MRVRDRLRRVIKSRGDAWDRSRERWRAAKPDAHLTWGAELTGDAFIDKAAAQSAFGPDRRVLEVGPGYGRVLRSCLEREIEFESWLGVDLSADNVAFLGQQFADERIRFIEADVERVVLDQPVDTVLSSLTFKHLYPSFEAALANLAPQLRPGGLVLFDLVEGERSYFEEDDVTYIRWYPRDEVDEIVHRAGLEPVGFDEVQHHPDITRLLVVARRPDGS
ncbi:MAG: class I SAM-dependent methyltransferase [Solirubrobacterales bacterium]